MASCSSCGAEIEWGSMRGTGRPMPVDPPELDPHDARDGIVAVRRRDRLSVVLDTAAAMKVRASAGSWSEWTFHMAHWSSCPSAESHRVNPNQETLL